MDESFGVPWSNYDYFHVRLHEVLLQMGRAWRMGNVEHMLTCMQEAVNMSAAKLNPDKVKAVRAWAAQVEARVNHAKQKPQTARQLLGEAGQIMITKAEPLFYEALHEANMLLPARWAESSVDMLGKKLGMSGGKKKPEGKEGRGSA